MPPDSFVCPNVSRIGSCAQINSIVAQRQRPILWTLFYHWIVDISLCIGWMFPITMTGLILVCFKSWIIANSEHRILALYSHVCPYVRMCSSVTFLFLFFQTLSSRNLSHGFQCSPSMSPMPASQLVPLPSQLVPQWTGSHFQLGSSSVSTWHFSYLE